MNVSPEIHPLTRSPSKTLNPAFPITQSKSNPAIVVVIQEVFSHAIANRQYRWAVQPLGPLLSPKVKRSKQQTNPMVPNRLHGTSRLEGYGSQNAVNPRHKNATQ